MFTTIDYVFLGPLVLSLLGWMFGVMLLLFHLLVRVRLLEEEGKR